MKSMGGFIRNIGHKNYDQSQGLLHEPQDYVVQIKDDGSFWDSSVAERALRAIEMDSKETNIIILIYIHGWHHNASVSDGNVKDFASSLVNVRETLDDNLNGIPGVYRESRLRLTGNGDVKIIGIYLGWRGKSLPMPFDYLTFWGRKAAAERVGQGHLRGFLLKLNEIYTDRNAARSKSLKTPFVGMVSFGHSFGGQVLFKAIAPSIEDSLKKAVAASQNEKEFLPSEPLSGFGDVVILINPALESLQYEQIDKLHRQINYDRRQTPILVTLSSATDLARKLLFPLGMWVTTLISPTAKDGKGTLRKKALGEYLPQRTHSVELIDGVKFGNHGFDPKAYTDAPCNIVNYDLTDMPVIGGVALKPIEGSHHPHSPFLVAYASGKVILRHSGIFKKELRNFLNDYVAITEGKKMLLSDPRMANCPE